MSEFERKNDGCRVVLIGFGFLVLVRAWGIVSRERANLTHNKTGTGLLDVPCQWMRSRNFVHPINISYNYIPEKKMYI